VLRRAAVNSPPQQAAVKIAASPSGLLFNFLPDSLLHWCPDRKLDRNEPAERRLDPEKREAF
jgi:hypothetical protein